MVSIIFLFTSKTISAFSGVSQGQSSDVVSEDNFYPRVRTSEGITNKQHLRHHDRKGGTASSGGIEIHAVGEDRDILSTAATKLAGKVKTNINKLLHWKLTKMEKMYRDQISPGDLAMKYGTKRAQFQKEYRQHYRWRESWKLQRPYRLPGKSSIGTS
ncbi:hypothetical protein PHMEG_00029988 [Phytophthora megakarya]|uniref:RxLR effector protein n=1 Tax=Phytophthora megakarya TaxID=4795 RepID=A0A225V164_9STRA|nr:hypothetical protein PHMEG_00029988 [Phytophthora megakarya]